MTRQLNNPKSPHVTTPTQRHQANPGPYRTLRNVGRVAQGISALGSHGTVRNSLPLHGSYHPGYTGNMIQAQWAKSKGYCLVILCHAVLALRYLLSRLYFLRIQRIR
jgi:hypothetical protein